MNDSYIIRAADISPAILPIDDLLRGIELTEAEERHLRSKTYSTYYRHQLDLRGLMAGRENEKESSFSLPIIWGSIHELLDRSKGKSFVESKLTEPWSFYFRLLKYLVLTPIYRYKQTRIALMLIAKGIPRPVRTTYSAIAQATDVFNNFLLDLPWFKQCSYDFAPTDLCALYIQLADEFIDNVKETICTESCIALLKKHWTTVFGSDDELPFSRGINSLFEMENIDLRTIETKYGIQCDELLAIVHTLGEEIFHRVRRFDGPRKRRFIEKFRLTIEQAFSTFLEELYISRSGMSQPTVDKDLLEHYERKTSSVLGAWLELRAINAGLTVEVKSKEIRQWSRLFFDFQIFDDLKDIRQDFGKQPNLLHAISNSYPQEASWLVENIASLTVDGELHGTLKINLNMPQSVAHLKLVSHVNGNAYFSPFLKATQNYRWKKSWLSSYFSFQKKSNPVRVDKVDGPSLYVTDGRPLLNAALVALVSSITLYEQSKSEDLYFAHCLDILEYDDKGYIYRHCSLRNIWYFLIFAPTMRLQQKGEMFCEVLRNGGVMDEVIEILSIQFCDSIFLQDVAKRLSCHA